MFLAKNAPNNKKVIAMEEAPFYDEDNETLVQLFGPDQQNGHCKTKPNLDNLVPSEEIYQSKANGNSIYSDQIEQQITESLDQLSTKSDQDSSSDEADEQYRKKARVGNHYQARIPKYLSGGGEYSNEDELLWDPFIIDTTKVEDFLRRISSLTKLLIPMGNHLRDDEEALYILQKNSHDVDGALNVLCANKNPDKSGVWSEEECRTFERGLLSFGKNFFLIQKYRMSTRRVSELVQFYYLWKKTERYDLFANRLRGSKKKYALNPGISELMCRYLGHQNKGSDVQFIVTSNTKDVPQESSQC